MRSDEPLLTSTKSSDHAKATLIEEFPELNSDNLILNKEVLAHFGLLFSAFALIENSMINVVTFNHSFIDALRTTIHSVHDWSCIFDKNEAASKKLTFGQLADRVVIIEEYTQLLNNIKEIKKIRNYFAHHFLREEAAYFSSDESCWFLLEKMNSARHKVKFLEAELDKRFEAMCIRLKYALPDSNIVSRYIAEEFKAAHQAVVAGTAKVGWE